ncbi:MAG: aminotransferase class III-fold pyridoxal phosphate-dependent enzyme [Candidatus Lernaella stagnicola]|nr:aminotransferase class III-fold pyridoxal phosphate-dependent enzyme [Candidatus Lernaella stagnicola]
MSTRKNETAALADFRKYVSAAQVRQLKKLGHDFVETAAEGAFLTDDRGRRYLDCYTNAGIHNLGRRPAAVAAALREGLRVTDQGNFPMISREKALLAEKLAHFVPGPAECTVFGVVRGEAFDCAAKLARGHTGQRDLVAPRGSWFGQTGFALSLSAHPYRDDYAPLVPGSRIVDFTDAEAVRSSITADTAAVFIEPFQTENHCATFTPKIWRALWQRCGENGTLLVVDETQCGFGRTGRRFGYEHFDVQPDTVILGEALGAGVFPICGTIFSPALNTFMNDHPLIHLSTFGGSDLGCTVASAALDAYEQSRPWENAARRGAEIRTGLHDLIDPKGKALLSMAGEGLLLSLAFSSPTKATSMCRALAGAGVFAKPGCVAQNTVLLRPPLTIDEEDVALLVTAIQKAVKSLSTTRRSKK